MSMRDEQIEIIAKAIFADDNKNERWEDFEDDAPELEEYRSNGRAVLATLNIYKQEHPISSSSEHDAMMLDILAAVWQVIGEGGAEGMPGHITWAIGDILRDADRITIESPENS